MNALLILAAAATISGPQPAPPYEGAILPPPTVHGVMVVPKPMFKDRHPRIYKAYRKTRFVFIAIKPFVDVASDCAILFVRRL